MDWGLLIGATCIAIYFGALLYALTTVCGRTLKSYHSLLRANHKNSSDKHIAILVATLLLMLAAAAGASTWYYIVRFFEWTFIDQAHSHWQTWIAQSDLFIQAYRMVSKTPLHWFWSSLLLLLTCGFVSLLKCTGSRRAWQFALLGFLGAISVALSLFLADLLCREVLERDGDTASRKAAPREVGPVLGISILIALASIVANSLLDISTLAYVVNLILLHVILLVALIPEPERVRIRRTPLSLWLKALARFSMLYGLLQIIRIYRADPASGLSGIALNLASVVFENVCQASITLDLWFSLGSILVFGLYKMASLGQGRHSHMAKAAP